MKNNFFVILKIVLICILSVFYCGFGCARFNRTVYVPEGQAFRLRETIKNVKVSFLNKDKEEIEGKVDLLEGWFCLSYDPSEE